MNNEASAFEFAQRASKFAHCKGIQLQSLADDAFKGFFSFFPV